MAPPNRSGALLLRAGRQTTEIGWDQGNSDLPKCPKVPWQSATSTDSKVNSREKNTCFLKFQANTCNLWCPKGLGMPRVRFQTDRGEKLRFLGVAVLLEVTPIRWKQSVFFAKKTFSELKCPQRVSMKICLLFVGEANLLAPHPFLMLLFNYVFLCSLSACYNVNNVNRNGTCGRKQLRPSQFEHPCISMSMLCLYRSTKATMT